MATGVFCLKILLLLFFCAGVTSKLTKEVENRTPEDDHIVDVEEKYGVLWDRVAAVERSMTSDLESVPCEGDKICHRELLNLDVAFQFQSDLPTKPFCANETTATGGAKPGFCTCGEDRCVSYSRDWSNNGHVFYYCGPCGWVGSECDVNQTCTHTLGYCSNDFCECKHDGIFYDMAYCFMPFYGRRMIIQMFISTAVIVALCGALAYSYHRFSGSRRNDLRRFANWRRSSTVRESPPDDIPPTYDDVVEKVPSYQDALEMEKNYRNMEGLENPGFEDDYSLPPAYQETRETNLIETSDNTTSTTSTDTAENSRQSNSISLQFYLPKTTPSVSPEEQQPNTTPSVSPEEQQPNTTISISPEEQQPNTTTSISLEEQQPKPAPPEMQPIEQPLKEALDDMSPSSDISAGKETVNRTTDVSSIHQLNST